jgi:hypothetical protein
MDLGILAMSEAERERLFVVRQMVERQLSRKLDVLQRQALGKRQGTKSRSGWGGLAAAIWP